MLEEREHKAEARNQLFTDPADFRAPLLFIHSPTLRVGLIAHARVRWDPLGRLFFRFRGCWRSGGGGSIEDDEESNNPLLFPRVVGGFGERVPEGAKGTADNVGTGYMPPFSSFLYLPYSEESQG